MKLHRSYTHPLPGVGYWGERPGVPLRINFGILKQGAVCPEDLPHYHKTRVTYFCILQGSMEVEVDGEMAVLTSDVMLEVPALSVYRMAGIGKEGCTWVVVGNHNEDDRVEVNQNK